LLMKYAPVKMLEQKIIGDKNFWLRQNEYSNRVWNSTHTILVRKGENRCGVNTCMTCIACINARGARPRKSLESSGVVSQETSKL